MSRSCQWNGAANGASDSATISADGRFIAYRSFASDVVPNDTNGVPDVFLYDRSSGITSLLSLSAWETMWPTTDPATPSSAATARPSCSRAGRRIWRPGLQPKRQFTLKLATSGTNKTFGSELRLPSGGGRTPHSRLAGATGRELSSAVQDDWPIPLGRTSRPMSAWLVATVTRRTCSPAPARDSTVS